jgi:hypothetical protein
MMNKQAYSLDSEKEFKAFAPQLARCSPACTIHSSLVFFRALTVECFLFGRALV